MAYRYADQMLAQWRRDAHSAIANPTARFDAIESDIVQADPALRRAVQMEPDVLRMRGQLRQQVTMQGVPDPTALLPRRYVDELLAHWAEGVGRSLAAGARFQAVHDHVLREYEYLRDAFPSNPDMQSAAARLRNEIATTGPNKGVWGGEAFPIDSPMLVVIQQHLDVHDLEYADVGPLDESAIARAPTSVGIASH
jgi:hypothetical protein